MDNKNNGFNLFADFLNEHKIEYEYISGEILKSILKSSGLRQYTGNTKFVQI